MSKSLAYRLGRLYGRLSQPSRFALLAVFGIGLTWLLLPSETPSANTATSNTPVHAAPPRYDPVAKWGQSAVASANKVMTLAQQDCVIYEEGSHLVVDMKTYIGDPNRRLQYIRSIADSDVILNGKPRNIYFYDPSHKKIAQADTVNGVRLVE